MVHRHGVKMRELFFCVRGGFGLYNKYCQADPRRPVPPFAVIASVKTHGDYQLLFDLYPNMDFKTYVHDFRHAAVENYLRQEDFDATEYVVMELDADIFQELCQLYPRTCTSLKYRALDRRNFFLKTMQAQEKEYGLGRDMATGLKRPGMHTLDSEIIF